MNIEELEKLNELKEKGILTQEEFDKKKEELLQSDKKNKETVSVENKNLDEELISKMNFIVLCWRAFVKGLKNCVNIKDRSSRLDYFGFLFILTMICVPIGTVASALEIDIIHLFLLIIFALPTVTLLIRRMKDTGTNPWWILTYFVPLVKQFFKGDEGVNKYGPAPTTSEKKENTIIIMYIIGYFVISGLSGGVVAGFQNSMSKAFVRDELETITQNVRIMYASASNYSTLNGKISYQVGIIGDKNCANSDCSDLKNALGYPMSIFPSEDARSWYIGYVVPENKMDEISDIAKNIEGCLGVSKKGSNQLFFNFK
ncbi:MAG: DUF805 domain-containing protein [Alphaproteobacteria bacterium]|nr:DUF805 domain-containing protein [Alphaproteobacteria bacterium]